MLVALLVLAVNTTLFIFFKTYASLFACNLTSWYCFDFMCTSSAGVISSSPYAILFYWVLIAKSMFLRERCSISNVSSVLALYVSKAKVQNTTK